MAKKHENFFTKVANICFILLVIFLLISYYITYKW